MVIEAFESSDSPVLPRPDFLPPFERPLTDIERWLVTRWERLLNLAPIGVDDNFFDLGGDSFMVVTVFAEIESTWGVVLPPSIIVEAPTVRELARRLEQTDSDSVHPGLVVFNDSGSKPPLYFVHGRGGEIIFAMPIADVLDRDQPFFGIRYAPGRDSWPRPLVVEDIAATYATMIRERHGHGPYRICGYSIGAVIAFEIAQCLRRAGCEIEGLILVDPAQRALSRSDVLRSHMRDVFSRSPADAARVIRTRFVGLARRSIERGLLKRFGFRSAGRRPERDPMWDYLRTEFVEASRLYRPQVFHGDAVVITSEETRRIYGDAALGWGAFVSGKVHIVEIGGTHRSIIGPPLIGELARHIADTTRAMDRD